MFKIQKQALLNSIELDCIEYTGEYLFFTQTKFYLTKTKNIQDLDYDPALFSDFIVLDLAFRSIYNVEFIVNKNLNNIQTLNMTGSALNDISSLPKIRAKKLRYLFLGQNQIKDYSPLLDCDFPNLNILFVDRETISAVLVEKISKKFSCYINVFQGS